MAKKPDDRKAQAVQSRKWVVITLHPWLPSHAEQLARARAWGVPEIMAGKLDISTVIVDDVRKVKRTTNWMSRLPERAAFLKQARAFQAHGDTVFFATPLCVGFSARLAEQTIRELWAAGMHVYVHAVHGNGSALYVEGDDLTEFLEAVSAQANAAHQRDYRAARSPKSE